MKADPIKELQEIRNQLSYSKRIGFLLGAGTSKSIGLSDIEDLTNKVRDSLDGKLKDDITKLKDCISNPNCTIEDLLSHARLIRELTGADEHKSYETISGKAAKELDIAICNKIYEIIVEQEKGLDISTTKKFVSWYNWINRDYSKEIFTLNYDLLLEKSFESMQIPYYDGFIGANEPFFLAESLENDLKQNNIPLTWIKYWKMHGSLGWFWKNDPTEDTRRIVRLGIHAKDTPSYDEIVIYPSREKYIDSRKQPLLSYIDRLRSYLLNGEGLFIISGYSFRDEHINTIIFDCLRHNNRLHILSFFFSDDDIDRLSVESHTFMNLSCFGPKKSIIKGNLSEWESSTTDDSFDQFWDKSTTQFLLGDFKKLVDFLLFSSGRKEIFEKDIVAL